MTHAEVIERLESIQEELDSLSEEAQRLFLNHFPALEQEGSQYDAFSFGRSWNRYDTTFETLLNSARSF
jgi:hypothetical protein